VAVEGGVLRTRNDQPTLWDAIIPPELLELPEQLAKVDRLLDDERFFAPFVRHFHPSEGRPSIPMETYLRLVFLKYRYRLGYEPLEAEVADSLPRVPDGALRRLARGDRWCFDCRARPPLLRQEG
jgi:hypothetical protein